MDSLQMGVTGGQMPIQEQGKGGVSGSTIKIIAVVTMLIDHFAAAILMRMLVVRGIYSLPGDYRGIMRWLAENGVLYYGMSALRMVGRLGFPIFCFLLVEGFQKTHDLRKYTLRLGLFALISEIPFDLAFSAKVLEFNYQNVYFTLFLGILGLTAFDFFGKKELGAGLRGLFTAAGILLLPLYAGLLLYRRLSGWPFVPDGGMLFPLIFGVLLTLMLIFYVVYRNTKGADRAWRTCADLAVLALAMFAADFLRTDYGGMGVLTISVMYLFRQKKVICMLAGCIVLTLMSFSEIPAFLTLLPIAFYNGKRGLKMKYFFYAFYPVHLLILWLIAVVMGMGWIATI